MATVNEKMIQRIEDALPRIPSDHSSREVLTYIKKSLTPEGIEARDEWDKSVAHLHEVAAERLRPYETKESVTS